MIQEAVRLLDPITFNYSLFDVRLAYGMSLATGAITLPRLWPGASTSEPSTAAGLAGY